MRRALRASVALSGRALLLPQRRSQAAGGERGWETDLPADAPAKPAEVDPFRVGYSIGAQSVHLEAVRMKLSDHLELLKSHFHALTEKLNSSQDQMTQFQVQYDKTVSHEVREANAQILGQLLAMERQMKSMEESLKCSLDDRISGLQRHIDDCFENLKDTVKLGFGVLVFLNLWMFYTISQNHRQYINSRAPHGLSSEGSALKHK